MAVLGALLFGACTADETIEVREAAIVEGEPELRREGVVYLFAQDMFCTAAIVGPRTVLTAKHCVEQSLANCKRALSYRRCEASGDVRVGSEFEAPARSPEWIWTTRGGELEGLDLALLSFVDAFKTPPLVWSKDSTSLAEGAEILAVGYGQREMGDPSAGHAGVKMRASTLVQDVALAEFSVEGPTTCYGDSGGPALDRRERVVGVVSRGRTDCAGPSIYTRTDYYRQLITLALVGAGDVDASALEGLSAPVELEQPMSLDDSVAIPSGTVEPHTSHGCSVGPGAPSSRGFVVLTLLSFALLAFFRRHAPTASF